MALIMGTYRLADVDAATVRELLSYDPTTGILKWRKSKGRAPAGSIAGSLGQDGYLRIGINRRIYKAHRLIWLLMYREWPGIEVDHINGNPTDNRLVNLRNAGRSANRQNLRGPTSISATGLLGVYPNRGSRRNPYRFQIRLNGKAIHLGSFHTKEDAQREYLKVKRRIHIGCSI